MITQKFKRGTKLFLTLNKTTIENIRFATSGSVTNFVYFIWKKINILLGFRPNIKYYFTSLNTVFLNTL